MINEILIKIEADLPKIARSIAERNTNLSELERRTFLEGLDSPEQHKPKWHQWGIITHSRKFKEYYEMQIVRHLRRWRFLGIEQHLQEKIESISKYELLKIVALLHDLGKFNKSLKPDRIESDFEGHAKFSEIHIREMNLKTYELSESQIDYVAKCARMHYELGDLRYDAKQGPGYNMLYAKSHEATNDMEARIRGYKGFAVEVGVMFLADCLAKTEVFVEGSSDEEINKNSWKAEKEIYEKNLHPNLILAARQSPVNLEITKKYLQILSH
jgi:hypothetical protein